MVENLDGNSIDENSMSMVRHKIIFVGDVAVGKTSLIKRLVDNQFKELYDVYNT